jgi:Icc-related predicted phosphoesterase
MKIALISDTHTLHREVEVPRCDILIHAGDICFMGRSARDLDDFAEWLSEQPAQYRVIVPGNHDTPIAENLAAWRDRLSIATLLVNESVTIEGIRIWGSPVSLLADVPFGIPYENKREQLYSTIPPDTDVLVTHGPPLGVLDCGQGCAALRRAVIRVKPKLHVFGHVHSGYGTRPTQHTLFVNASALNEEGAPSHPPVILNLKDRR